MIRGFAWFLIVAGSFFAYVYLANPGLTFPGARITDYSSQLGFYSTSVRVIGSVVGLGIAVLLNDARLLAIMLATRLVIESGDIIVGLVIGGPLSNTVMLVLLALAELAATVKLVQVVRGSVRSAPV